MIHLKPSLTDSVSFRDHTWSINKALCKTFSNTMKVGAMLFASFVPLVPLVLLDDNKFNFKITNRWLLSGSQLCTTLIGKPIVNLSRFVFDSTPRIEYDGIKISQLLIGTALEDIVFVGLIQRTALPLFAKLLPKRCGNIVNHKVTRVVLSSAIFALAHDYPVKNSEFGVIPQFCCGVISGTVAELDDSLFLPIIYHFAFDLILGAGSKI